MFDTIVNGVT